MTPPPEGGRRLGLFPGSATPENDGEVDQLLRLVPSFAFVPELGACVFGSLELSGPAGESARARLERMATEEYLERVRRELERVKERAQRESDGGLLFLATTLGHFLGAVPVTEHPLLVALYCRAVCRTRGQDTPAPVAMAMDAFEAGR